MRIESLYDTFLSALESEELDNIKKVIVKNNVNSIIVYDNEIDKFKIFSENEINFNDIGESYETPLSWVIYSKLDIIEYLISIGANTDIISKKKNLLIDVMNQEYQEYNDGNNDLTDNKIKLLVKYIDDVNYIYKFDNYISKDFICKSPKETLLDCAIIHPPAFKYLRSVGAKTARELEKEEILSKEDRNEYEDLVYFCFNGDLDKIKEKVNRYNVSGLEGYIYSPLFACFESKSEESINFLVNYIIDLYIIKNVFYDLIILKSRYHRLEIENNLNKNLFEIITSKISNINTAYLPKSTILNLSKNFKYNPYMNELIGIGAKTFEELENK